MALKFLITFVILTILFKIFQISFEEFEQEKSVMWSGALSGLCLIASFISLICVIWTIM